MCFHYIIQIPIHPGKVVANGEGFSKHVPFLSQHILQLNGYRDFKRNNRQLFCLRIELLIISKPWSHSLNCGVLPSERDEVDRGLLAYIFIVQQKNTFQCSLQDVQIVILENILPLPIHLYDSCSVKLPQKFLFCLVA